MNEKPIIFSGPMVRAILAGTKTQTRRLVKWPVLSRSDGSKRRIFTRDDAETLNHLLACPGKHPTNRPVCPYGVPGDRLWVKENFRLRADQDDKPPSMDWWKAGAWYEADGNCQPCGCAGGAGKLRPSIFMPRWASRLTLEITDVRVQRLQEISDADAIAEGVGPFANSITIDCETESPKRVFAGLWNSINGKLAPWESNPWVWAISFRRLS